MDRNENTSAENDLDYLMRRGFALDEIGRQREHNGVTVAELARLERAKQAQGRTLAEPPDGTPKLMPEDFSDAGSAAVFARKHRDDLIYTDALGWLWWNGKKWERDDHMALARAIELSEEMLAEAGDEVRAAHLADGPDRRERAALARAYLDHARGLRNAPRLKSMLELARPALVKKADTLDADPFRLNTPAGIVDLTTGALGPHDRGAYCSRMTAASPDGEGMPVWDEFLAGITGGDGGMQGFLQLAAGMALIGAVYHEGVVIAWGSGRNGKSTFFNALLRVLGDYGGTIDARVLTTERQNRGAQLASLRGKRLVLAGELEEHQRLSAATLKQLASTDLLTIEEKYRQPETVRQSHTLVLFTNHLPRVGSTDAGTWRRLTVAPFLTAIPEDRSIPNMADLLVEKAGGAILRWAVEGARLFFRNGLKLQLPEAVEEATEAYRRREDWLENFLDERCVRDVNGRVRSADLYRAYRDWALSCGEYVRRMNDFASALEAAGFRKVKSKGSKYWTGIIPEDLREYQHSEGCAANM